MDNPQNQVLGFIRLFITRRWNYLSHCILTRWHVLLSMRVCPLQFQGACFIAINVAIDNLAILCLTFKVKCRWPHPVTGIRILFLYNSFRLLWHPIFNRCSAFYKCCILLIVVCDSVYLHRKHIILYFTTGRGGGFLHVKCSSAWTFPSHLNRTITIAASYNFGFPRLFIHCYNCALIVFIYGKLCSSQTCFREVCFQKLYPSLLRVFRLSWVFFSNQQGLNSRCARVIAVVSPTWVLSV